MKVVDTPDVVNADMTKSEQRQEVDRWRHVTKAKPSLVLLAVRCDVRYTAEEYAIYKKVRSEYTHLQGEVRVHHLHEGEVRVHTSTR